MAAATSATTSSADLISSLLACRNSDGYLDIERYMAYAGQRHTNSMAIIGDVDGGHGNELLAFVSEYDNISLGEDDELGIAAWGSTTWGSTTWGTLGVILLTPH
jgi:hypothetical protein